ncbi:DUF2750 domain-containing protein [Paenibacillus glycanilyticus]|uniref:DUF2750 domain-containing protein n=1 Tax=Paenibacillus glycanilyticus TaxID=126569 RepID=UPI00203BB4E3|nr:DUF2750 domain-containing protein [Paenibacillus glycanilyticus]MCM3628913.1 DUF2750 domain-containing protein [Paenibacillus glycanilyticus]
MNQKEFEAILKEPPNIRYEYFIKKVTDFEEVWGLYDEGWATADDGEGNMCIPFFPRKEFAQHCATEEWSSYKCESIDLYEFIDEWLIGMKEDKVKVSIFPNEDTAIAEVEVLLRDLKNELEKYE